MPWLNPKVSEVFNISNWLDKQRCQRLHLHWCPLNPDIYSVFIAITIYILGILVAEWGEQLIFKKYLNVALNTAHIYVKRVYVSDSVNVNKEWRRERFHIMIVIYSESFFTWWSLATMWTILMIMMCDVMTWL